MKWKWFLVIPLLALATGCATSGGSASGGSGASAPNVYVAREAKRITKVGILPFKAVPSLIGGSVSD